MDMSAVEDDEMPRVSAEITRLLKFPFGAEDATENTLDAILNHLPPQPRAWSLYEVYEEHASWIFAPLKREEVIDDILSPIYKAVKEKQTSGSSAIESISRHKLAVLFFIFALGALVDLTLEPCKLPRCFSQYQWMHPHLAALLDSADSETYYHLGCACLSLRSVFDSPEVSTIQAVFLMASFHTWGGKKHTMDSAVRPQSIGVESYLTFPFSGL
jgi:hypothetical protein